jgi:hypothetical protein
MAIGGDGGRSVDVTRSEWWAGIDTLLDKQQVAVTVEYPSELEWSGVSWLMTSDR